LFVRQRTDPDAVLQTVLQNGFPIVLMDMDRDPVRFASNGFLVM